MLIAIDKNNNRIIPEKGKIGFCQLCKEKVRAYCGEINIDHWRHFELQNCDNWSEGETEWHREWKNEFPKDWQEIIIENQFEIHIADIKTQNNLVLELQNSSISSTTIKIREKFYGNMIWLINANKFKDNFKIGSLVTYHLRILETLHRNMMSYVPEDNSTLKDAIEEQKDIEYNLKDTDYKISNKESKISDVEELLKNIKNTVQEFLGSKYFYSSEMNGFESTEKEKLDLLNVNSIKLETDLNNKQSLLLKIKLLENCEIENYEHFKFINPNQIGSSSFSKCALVEKETEKSFFPNILKFKSEFEFNQIAKNQKYRLIVNPLDIIQKIKKEIIELENEINNSTNEKKATKKKISIKLESYLIESRNQLNKEKVQLEKIKLDLKNSLILKKISIESIALKENEEKEKQYISIENQHKQDRIEIMKKYKGLYYYTWKHKRKSWDFSVKKIYLDFENAIFERIDESTLSKLKKSEFIENVKNWW